MINEIVSTRDIWIEQGDIVKYVEDKVYNTCLVIEDETETWTYKLLDLDTSRIVKTFANIEAINENNHVELILKNKYLKISSTRDI